MHNKYKFQKGDISLLVTLLICSIILILLAPIAQKVSVESKISRENLMSQQAIQAAKTGLDAWVYYWLNDEINTTFSDTTNWPNSNTTTLADITLDGDWIILDNSSNIQYKVKFIDSNPPKVVSTGRVNRDGFTIERVLEDEREDL
jgi:hypothetical protein